MDMNKKVMVKSHSNATVVFHLPDLGFTRTFEKKGAVKPVPFDVLAQSMYDNGAEAMFKLGILTIEDKEARIELGLEEEVFMIDDAQKKRLLTIAPLHDLKETCKKMNEQQLLDLVYFAIDNELGNFDKASFLKEITSIDIIKAIELNKAAKED
jgi:hypothetical protein